MNQDNDQTTVKHFVNKDVIEKLKKGEVKPVCFADVSDGNDFGAIAGRKARINDVLGRNIVITGFQTAPSRKKADARCITIQFLMDGDLRIIWTGSVVLQRLLEKYAEQMPFQTRIQRCNDALVLE